MTLQQLRNQLKYLKRLRSRAEKRRDYLLMEQVDQDIMQLQYSVDHWKVK